MLIATGVTRHMILAGDPGLEEVGGAARCRSILRDAGTKVAEVAALARLFPEPDGTKHVSLVVGDTARRHGTRAKRVEVTTELSVWKWPVPGGSLWRVVAPDDFPVKELYVTSAQFECALRSRQLSVGELALLMTVQCASFRYNTVAEKAQDGILYGTDAWATVRDLEDFLACADAPWHGRRRYARAIELAFEGCASVPEAKTAVMLSTPRRLGGMGIGRPEINKDVEIPEELLPLMAVRKGLRYDEEWGGGADVEYDGWPHDNEEAMLDDKEKALASLGMGRTVLSVTKRTWEDFDRFEVFARILGAKARKRQLPEAKDEVREAQRALFESLRAWDPVC